ncbi:hypothetical protein G9Q84_20500 [Pseudomonas sp. P7]|uniref:hypothetical protein n=1 Tax=Pseudomonas sivasensis TaxID=1880678 RepID=UPI0015ECCE3F|nr:hypothetical protein [Pseudomonas sivasensis]MBA2925265.1 hypothetical protein [Pseudomonas sivasensis]
MSSSLDHFSRGLSKAVERRAKAQQQAKQIVEKIHGDSDAIITKTTKVASINTGTLSADEKRYRTYLITNMIKLIHSKRKSI